MAWVFNSMAGCQARAAEARYKRQTQQVIENAKSNTTAKT